MQHMSWQCLPQFKPNFLGVKIFSDHHIVRPKLLGSKTIWTQNYLGPKILLGSNIFWPKLFWIQNYILTQFFFTQNFLDKNYFWPKNFRTQNVLNTQFFGHKISLHPIFFTYQADSSWFYLILTNKTTQFSWVLTQLKLV